MGWRGASALRPAPEKVRVADQIVETLIKHGVKKVFGIPGGAIAPVYDALLDRSEIEVVSCKHETMAVFAAAAYARATDGVGVVLVTSGPGVTNAVTGLASAYCDSLPLVLMAGEVPRNQFGRGALQEGSPYVLDLRGMVQSITKDSLELTTAEAATAVVGKALATARSGRKGPVFVSLPLDVTRSLVCPHRIGAQVSAQFVVENTLLDDVADLLAGAERPLILAGSGARWGAGPQQLLRLAERAAIPVASTPKAKGVFPEDHPLALGVYGFGGHPSARRYLEGGVDVLFAIGTSFGEVATNAWNGAIKASKHFIQLDIDAAQIGKNYRADIGLVGPAEVLLQQLLGRVPQARRLVPVRGVERYSEPETLTAPGPIKPQRALWEVQKAVPEDAIYCVDIGDHLLFALHYLQLTKPDSFYFSGLASMGSGIGASIGVKLALPKRPVVCICGDGSVSMAGTELLTAAQEKLPILFAVLDDHRYGMVERGNKHVFGRTPRYSSQPLDIAGLATKLGIPSASIVAPGQILELDLASRLREGPLLLDIQIDPEEGAPGTERFKSLSTEMRN